MKTTFIEEAQDIIDKITPLFPGKQIQPSFLRSDITLSSSNTNYSVALRKDSPAVGEVMLGNNDVFIATHVGFYLTYTATSSNPATKQLFTYPDARLIAASSADGMKSIYNTGRITYSQGQVVKLDSLDVSLAYKVQRTQYNVTAGTAPTENSLDLSIDGLIPLSPKLYILGNDLLNVQFNVAPGGADIDATSPAAIGVAFIHRGVLVKGVADEFVKKMAAAIESGKIDHRKR